ncbi:hypothetical protein BSZ35_09100 [Salinibacter sp. 10B]|nr:hypothetical protein BSZ35_09100 [Salinibacter sp. 10B]
MPRVSVIIPAYNMAEFVGQAITSVLDVVYNNVELIVIDDGSTDATERVVRQFAEPEGNRYDKRVRYLSQPNQGKPAAVNRGIEAMSGEYLALLDADDQLPPNSLTRRMEALRENPGTDMAIGGFEVIGEVSTVTLGERPCPRSLSPNRLKRAFCLSYRTPFHLNACLLHRSLVERVGPFDPELKRCQDIDYSIRCLKETQGIICVDESVYLYRKHRDSTRDRIGVRLSTIRHRRFVVLKNFSSPQKYIYIFVVLILGLSKLIYEIFCSYKS